jgi:hypothetical protein
VSDDPRAMERRIERLKAALTIAREMLWRMNAEYCFEHNAYPASNAELDYARELVDDTLQAEEDIAIDRDTTSREHRDPG